jgi:hypothetical protein
MGILQWENLLAEVREWMVILVSRISNLLAEYKQMHFQREEFSSGSEQNSMFIAFQFPVYLRRGSLFDRS